MIRGWLEVGPAGTHKSATVMILLAFGGRYHRSTTMTSPFTGTYFNMGSISSWQLHPSVASHGAPVV